MGKSTDITNYEVNQLTCYIAENHGAHCLVKLAFVHTPVGNTLVVTAVAWRPAKETGVYEYVRGKHTSVLPSGVPLVTAVWRTLFDLCGQADASDWHQCDWDWLVQVT